MSDTKEDIKFDSDLGMSFYTKFRLLFIKPYRIKIMETGNIYKVKKYKGIWYIVDEETSWLGEYFGNA